MEEARGQADGASDAAWNEYGRPSGQSDRDTPQIGVESVLVPMGNPRIAWTGDAVASTAAGPTEVSSGALTSMSSSGLGISLFVLGPLRSEVFYWGA